MKMIASLVLTLATYCALGQGYLNFSINTQFYDIDGTTFLAARQDGAITHVAEHEQNGNLIWEDSIQFPTGNDYIYIYSITRFGNTDKYLLTAGRALDGNLASFYDSTLYLQTILSTGSQSIVDSASVAFGSRMIYFAPKNDTTIYLFPEFFESGNAPGLETLTISENLDTTFIAPFDSIPSYGNLGSHACINYANQLNVYNTSTDVLSVDFYTENCTYVGYNSYTANTSPDFSDVLIYDINFQDSIFYFNCSSGNGSEGLKHEWAFAWLDYDLNVLNETKFFTPNYNVQPISGLGAFHWDTDQNKVVVAGQYIYVMGYLYPGDSLTIFTYDFDFNEICRIPLNTWKTPDKQLVKINGRAYYQLADGSNKYHFYEIDACSFATAEIKEEFSRNLLIYPNPATEFITIETQGSEFNSENHITIRNILGAEVYREIISSGNYFKIDVSSFPAGIYIVNITSDVGIDYTEKVIIE